METMVKDGGDGTAPSSAGRFEAVLSVGCGLAPGALAGIVVGLAAGVGIAMILRVL